MDKVTLYQDDSKEWRWTREAPNGEVVAASTEGYKRKTAAMDNIVRTQVGPLEIVDGDQTLWHTHDGGHDLPVTASEPTASMPPPQPPAKMPEPAPEL